MRRALPLLLVGLLAACTKHVAGETGSIQLVLTGPAGAQPFATADAVEVRIVDPGRTDPIVASVPWPPTDQSPLELLLTPDGTQWSLVVAARSGGAIIALGRSGPFDLAPAQTVTVPVFVGMVNAFGGAPVSLATARAGHSALTLPDPDGRLVVLGGADPQAGTPVSPTVELLDPLGRGATGDFGTASIPPRTLHGAVLTPDGKVVLTGGLDESGAPLADFWVLEVGQESPNFGLPTGMAARAGAAVALVGTWGGAAAAADAGKVLIAGGCASATLTGCSADAYVVGLNGEGRKVSGFDVVRFGATATPLPGHADVLVAGGRDDVGLASAVYLFDSHGNDAASVGTMNPITALLTPRERHVAVTLPDGSVLLAGGLDESGTPLRSAEVFVPWLGTAGRLLSAGALNAARYDATAVVLADGSVAIVGGLGGPVGTTVLDSVERFVPEGPNAGGTTYGGAFTTLSGRLPVGRASAAAALGPGGELLVSGGRNTAAFADLLVFVQCLSDEGLSSCPAP